MIINRLNESLSTSHKDIVTKIKSVLTKHGLKMYSANSKGADHVLVMYEKSTKPALLPDVQKALGKDIMVYLGGYDESDYLLTSTKRLTNDELGKLVNNK